MRTYRLSFTDSEHLATLVALPGSGGLVCKVEDETMWTVMGFKVEEVEPQKDYIEEAIEESEQAALEAGGESARDKVEETAEKGSPANRRQAEPKLPTPKPRSRKRLARNRDKGSEAAPGVDTKGSGEGKGSGEAGEAPHPDSD